MAHTPWKQRIRRAEDLSGQYPFAQEILHFYGHIARFQQELFQQIERSPAKRTVSTTDPGLEDLLASFPPFLSLVAEKAPAPLVQVAQDLRSSGSASWRDLLSQCWRDIDSPADPREFLALAFLQPYAEFIRSRVPLQLEIDASIFLCPFCNRKPSLSVLRQQGDGGRRSLLCGFCMTEWEFRRVICPGCGQEEHAKLPVYTAESFPHIRVECCDDCKTYIKSIDLTKNGHADPLVDELASVPLNLWAQEHGYAKLRPNLLGM